MSSWADAAHEHALPAHYQQPTISSCASQLHTVHDEVRPSKPEWVHPPGCSHGATLASRAPPKTKSQSKRKRALVPRTARTGNATARSIVIPPTRMPRASVGPLALGASIVELTSHSPVFAYCAELLHRQLQLHSMGAGVGLSVLRVLQLRNHFAESVDTLLSQSTSKNTPSRPSLVFVSGDSLGAIAGFVRSGLRLGGGHSNVSLDGGLVVSSTLTEKSCWGGATRAPSTDATAVVKPSLSVWRAVLAVCWPGQAACKAAPAFVVDYAVELTDLQLGFGQ